MKEKLMKQHTGQYVKGLFVRIIIACLIFILLFVGNLFAIDIMDYHTDNVILEMKDNTIIENIEVKLKDIFSKEGK